MKYSTERSKTTLLRSEPQKEGEVGKGESSSPSQIDSIERSKTTLLRSEPQKEGEVGKGKRSCPSQTIYYEF